MYLKQKHLVETPKYHKYCIDVRVENVRYNAVTSDVKKPGFIYKEWFHNGLTTELKHTFKKQTEFSDTYTWSVTDTIEIGEKISFSLGVPGEFGVSVDSSATFTASNTESQTKTKTETFSSEVGITVQPNTSVKAIFTVNEREMDVPWEADVIIGGYIAIWFEEKYNGHWLWFHPITALSNKDFKIRNGSELWFHNKGKFNGVHGIDSNVRIEEYPLQQGLLSNQSADEPAELQMLKCDHIVGKATASSGDKMMEHHG
ncbi:uncharacterized protein LOC117305223 [Asterias rubens]|uniref:uncharacterized protein LOC117305223 n=1 Tax=Asterias rubens TaxID=7604 RepID=UPI001454EA88|nr:uncharacterized protein LOC117305223 [Asterias rubens]